VFSFVEYFKDFYSEIYLIYYIYRIKRLISQSSGLKLTAVGLRDGTSNYESRVRKYKDTRFIGKIYFIFLQTVKRNYHM
jgi:hypothetical protein